VSTTPGSSAPKDKKSESHGSGDEADPPSATPSTHTGTQSATDTSTSAGTSTWTEESEASASSTATGTQSSQAFKLTTDDCIDPDLTKLAKGVSLMLCDGTIAEGSYEAPVLPDLSNLRAEHIKKGVVIAGVTGSYEEAQPDLTGLVAANLKAGVTINGITGTYDNRPADCAANGATGCVATQSYKAADLQMLAASNVKSGVTIAGVLGTFNGATAPSDCTGNGQVGCVSTTTWKSADLTNLTAGNLKSGVSVAGVTGSYDNRPADCLSNGQEGCVTTSTYKAASFSNLSAGNIKAGVVIAGVTGQYPSATYKLVGADTTPDLDASTLDARIKSASSFEWFDSAGTRYTATGDADITAANIKSGVTIFGAAGSVTTPTVSAWDLRKGVVVGSTTGLVNMHCRQRSGAGAFADQCRGDMYQDQTPNPDTCSTNGAACTYYDRVSGIYIARSAGAKTWANANSYCSSLTVNGVSGWRLPEKDELMQMYIQGVNSGTTNLLADGNTIYWSSSQGSVGYWAVRLVDTGLVNDRDATLTSATLCVK
jgi:hypothetical protein